MQEWLKEVARGKRGSKDLSYEQTREAAASILNGEATDAQIAGYLVAERIKTESPDEMLAFVHSLREHSQAIPVPSPIQNKLVDFAGPYNGRKSFIATIPVSILLSEYGIPAYLHSSDALPPKYGTTVKDVLTALGIKVEQTGQQIANSIKEKGIGFASTESFCASLGRLRPIREQLHVRTLLNTAEKVLNLSSAHSLMMGAYHRTAINKIYPLFEGLTYQNVYIVQGVEGSEDLPVHRNSFIFKISNETYEDWVVKPKDYGLLDKEFDKDHKLSIQEQAEITTTLLSGEVPESYRYYYNQVLFNAGIRYYLFGAVETIEEGISIAKEQLRSQRGLHQLESWKE
ncbi:anthranilate phosphoribosyltransferase [Pontibacillus yanchengensis]|uniref:Anthranilate phosphoribosyltransferase n=1 Tax=Pontibacillus yanchengensis TaxID=462910 RepID=A0A6I4ZUF5_9BACI|nr:anthranilate phosphoribosyltransferase [Pontibacillus yanchengensis]MYL33798.1 anthranilate phosphoribosyltransferase [Pontibacillus yanchengensis]